MLQLCYRLLGHIVRADLYVVLSSGGIDHGLLILSPFMHRYSMSTTPFGKACRARMLGPTTRIAANTSN